MFNFENVKIFECEKTARYVANEYKYCKVAVFKVDNEKQENLNQSLFEQGVIPIDVYVNGGKSLSVDHACNYVKIPEDVRLILCTDSSLVWLCKYISKALKIKCIILCKEYVPNLLSHNIAVRCGGEISTVNVTKNFSVWFNSYFVDCETAVIALSQLTVRLLDYLLVESAKNGKIDIELYNFVKRNLVNCVIRLEEDSTAIELKDLVYADYALSNLQSLSTFDVISAILNKNIDKNLILSICKYIMDSYFGCKGKIIANDLPDFRQRVDELTALFSLDRTFALKSVYNQISSINAQTTDKIEEELPILRNLFDRIIKIYKSCKKKITPVDFFTERAILLSGDTPLIVNSMSLLRQRI